MLGIWFHKFYEPKDLENGTKIITVPENNGLRIKQFLMPEGCDIDEVLCKCFKHQRSDTCSSQRSSSHDNFCSSKNFNFNLMYILVLACVGSYNYTRAIFILNFNSFLNLKQSTALTLSNMPAGL